MQTPAKILELTSQCVMCGICIPSCPTYQQSHDENESPRGRISLIQGVITKDIKDPLVIKEHIDSCLYCLSCQFICPSQVNYSEIISYMRRYYFSNYKYNCLSIRKHIKHLREHINNKVFAQTIVRKYFIAISNFLNIYKILPKVKWFAGKLNIKSLLILPDTIIKTYSTDNHSARIILFTGCANSLFNNTLIEHNIALFQALNISNYHIDENLCCGAIYNKQGNEPALQKTLKDLKDKYNPTQKIISFNSACSAFMLKDTENSNVFDIITYLAMNQWDKLNQLKFISCPNPIFFHQSCSVKNQLKNSQHCLKLLNLIPEITIKTLDAMNCCGASGHYMLTHALMAEKIADPLVNYIIEEDIHCIVSSDISCTLHIKQQLEKKQHYVEVLHPISLLYRQLSK